MRNYLFAFILLSSGSYAQRIDLSPQQAIRAQDFNSNFDFLENLLKFKQKDVEFSNFTSQGLISQEAINQELSKLSALGVSPNFLPLTGGKIKASELNALFSDVENKINALEVSLSVNQNVAKTLDLSSSKSQYPTSFSLTKNPGKGSVTINGSIVTYIPSLNSLGSDDFKIQAQDGNIASKEVKINVIISGEGIIDNPAGFKTYFDGSLASTCNDYKTVNSGGKKYSGSGIGNGIYKISIASTGGTQLVYCDMASDSYGWTLIASGGSSCTSFIQRGADSPAYPSHASYGANCGYLSRVVVKNIADKSSSVRLRVGGSATSYSQSDSTGVGPITSLRNNTDWHANNAYQQMTTANGVYFWNWSCTVYAGGWPDMFHACNYGYGVHWLAGHKHSHQDATKPSVSSTWVR